MRVSERIRQIEQRLEQARAIVEQMPPDDWRRPLLDPEKIARALETLKQARASGNPAFIGRTDDDLEQESQIFGNSIDPTAWADFRRDLLVSNPS
jgi:hypothetical protein